jgi:hypothetical protein
VDQGLGTVSATHTYDGNGLFTVTVTVLDDDGGSDIVTLDAFVEDAPLVDAGPDRTAVEGTLFTLDFSFIDAASETHDASVLWGDGSLLQPATVSQDLDTASASHIFAQNGVFIAAASVADDTGLSGLDTVTITVLNATPVADAVAGNLVADGAPFTIDLATFTDLGALDTHTAMIDWGDGTVATGTVDQDTNTVSGTHSFVELGSHLVTVTVTDSDGAIATPVVVTVLVFNPPPVPSMSVWSMGLTVMLLAVAGVWTRRQRKALR